MGKNISYIFDNYVHTYGTYLFQPPLSKHVHLCPLLIANHKLKFHFEMILEKENAIYLSDLLSLIFFSLSSRMASSYELNVHLMAEVKYHTHLSKNSGVDKFRDTLIYLYISKIVLFDY